MVAEVGHIDISGGIHGHAVRGIELRVPRAAAIAAESGHARAGNGGDHATGHLAHAVIVGVGEVEVAEAVDGDSLNVGEFGGQRRSTVADDGTAGHGLDVIGRTYGVGSPYQGPAGK